MRFRVAEIVDRMPVRIGLLCVVLAATLLLAPWAVFGASSGLDAYFGTDATASAQPRSMLWLGLGGIAGFAGAWVRLLYCAEQLDPHPRLKAFAAVALALGVVTAVALVAGTGLDVANPQFWLYAFVALTAGVLFAAIVQRDERAA
jgi:hypothetical protein